MKKVVIIKGNPKLIQNNKMAQSFYNEIKDFCEELGGEVMFDSGDPYTIPEIADLWIGHSRGCDRLRFAPKGVKTLAFGSSIEKAINDPRDNTKDLYGKNDFIPNEYHYTFTEEMKKAIKDALKK